MKKLLILVIYFLCAFILFGCSNLDGEGDDRAPLGSENGQSDIEAGQLTAGEWKDLDAFLFYRSLFLESLTEEKPFYPFRNHTYFQLLDLIEVQVLYESSPVPFATVTLLNKEDETLLTSVTDIFGSAYFFPDQDMIETLTVIQVEVADTMYRYEDEMSDLITIELDQLSNIPFAQVIDLMFVIDTTGSMADELSYLQAEIGDVIRRVSVNLEDVTIRLAFLFYRDITDDYITKYHSFSEDIEAQLALLKTETANGGGDFPEASDRALYEATRKEWSTVTSTKLLFHVADAPPHQDPDSMVMYKEAILSLQSMGVRIIPIASSGIDKETEFLMRAEAMMTGGTYVFLTNHSGIGREKIEPSVGNYVVEYLNDLLVRIIQTYHTGETYEKIPYNEQDQ